MRIYFRVLFLFFILLFTNSVIAGNVEIDNNTSLFFEKVFGLPTYISKLKIYNASCSKIHCVGIGATITHKNNGQDIYAPLLLISDDNGNSWRYSNAGIFNLMSREGSLFSLAYSKKTWIAVGYYLHYPFPWTNFYQATLMLVSKDNGVTWQEVGLNGKLPLQPDHGIVEDIKCYDSMCLAVGIGGGDEKLPLITRSENNGLSWSLVKKISGLTPTTEGSLFLEKIICKDETCIAAESSHWSSLSPQLLLSSHDKGKSWTQTQNMQNLPENFVESGIYDINCNDKNNCVAIGTWISSSKDGLDFRPMLLASNNGGDTWLFVQNIVGWPEKINWRASTYKKIEFSKDTYTVIGELETYDSKLILFKLLSYDKGLSWLFVQTFP